MEQISFKCRGCGIVHTLGKDAVVAIAADITVGAPVITDFGLASTLVDTHRHPDMIGRLPRSWSSLTPEEVRKHEADIARIQSDLAMGRPRWYQCWECKTVQMYEVLRPSVASVPSHEDQVDYDVVGRRIIAGLVDIVLLLAVFLLMAATMGEFGRSKGGGFEATLSLGGFGATLSWRPFVLYLLICYGYYVILEGITGSTLGKMAMKLKVVRTTGEPYGWTSVLLRNILRLVDGLPILYLVGLVSIAVTRKKQRLGDLAAKTLVVRKKPYKTKEHPETQEESPKVYKVDNAERLMQSGLVQNFVKQKGGEWNNQDWLGFLASVRSAGYHSLSDDQVGLLLEQEKVRRRGRMSASVREFRASDKSWRNADSPGSLVVDGIQVVEGTLAGKVMKVALIVVQDIKSLENNPEFVWQIREVANEAGDVHIDEESANNVRAFDLSLYNAIFKGKRLW